jgi:putative sterol carrier protein
MPTVEDVFAQMSARYLTGKVQGARSYYFSIGDVKRTVRLSPTTCTVEEGKTVESADCVLKADPKLFVDMVVHGKVPGALDIARGKLKTNDPARLAELKDLFRF